MPKGKLFFLFCLAFVCGIFISSFFNISWKIPAGFLILNLVLFLLFKLDKRFLVSAILFLAFMLGVVRYQIELGKILESQLRNFNDRDSEKVTLIGVINDEPDLKELSQQLRIKIYGLNNIEIKENLLVIASKYPSYRYGDKIKIEGKLKTPENFEKFNYQKYLQKERIYSMMIFPNIEVLELGQGNLIRQILFNFKFKFDEVWKRFLSPPHLGIFEALVFGEEENIPKIWKEKLNLSGTRHLTAVSGMNITIISFLLAGILLSLGFWRSQAALISLISIWLYIITIGAPLSGLRAGLMVSLFLIIQVLGRSIDNFRPLLFSAVILLIENPLILKSDIGFQLSFLAMTGLIFWQQFFKEKVFNKLPELFKLSLSTTFASQVFTLPILIYNFGYMSLVSPLTNLLLVPIIPFLTMIGFVFGSFGIIFISFAKILSWFLWLGISYVLLIVDLSLKIPFSHIDFKSVPYVFLLIVYLLLILITWKIGLMKRRNFI
ncbi:MAG: hypothetical protein COU70_00460 [Parcubacteria group bacterium CG10_big_fil_rev_8_21_14_0_10_35_15]|nr:MAG: hypothetical protein COU70_00460 [Parcubacteria group bacterium CG10_big_fil_rev_8_21_14_0_10_35_15]